MPRLVCDLVDFDVAPGTQDAIEVDSAQKPEHRIDNEYLRERLWQVIIVAHVIDGLADSPEWRHRDKFGLHTASGGFLRVTKGPAQSNPFGKRQLRQDLV